MALTADHEVKFYASQELIDVPVDDDVVIYKGAFVGLNASTGCARPLVAGDLFLGVAYRRADNTVAGHAAGGIRVRLHQFIDIVQAVGGVLQTDLGATVYASDDGTLTLTATSNSAVGTVIGIEGPGVARVRCRPHVVA